MILNRSQAISVKSEIHIHFLFRLSIALHIVLLLTLLVRGVIEFDHTFLDRFTKHF
jgi:hypothetical protein